MREVKIFMWIFLTQPDLTCFQFSAHQQLYNFPKIMQFFLGDSLSQSLMEANTAYQQAQCQLQGVVLQFNPCRALDVQLSERIHGTRDTGTEMADCHQVLWEL